MKNTQGTRYSNVHLDFRSRLATELRQRREKNIKISLRSFARFLKVDPSTLKKLMEGDRPLGAKTIRDLGLRLGLCEEEIGEYQAAHRVRRKNKTSLAHDQQRANYKILGPEFAPLISRWETYALIELLRLPAFKFSILRASKALGVSAKVIRVLLNDLEKCGWIEKKADGGWKPCIGATTTDPLNPEMNNARKILMQKILKKSYEAYAESPRGTTIHFGKTLSFDRSLLKDVMAKIRNFSDDLELLLKKEGQVNDVYQLQIGFYPVTTLLSEEEDGSAKE